MARVEPAQGWISHLDRKYLGHFLQFFPGWVRSRTDRIQAVCRVTVLQVAAQAAATKPKNQPLGLYLGKNSKYFSFAFHPCDFRWMETEGNAHPPFHELQIHKNNPSLSVSHKQGHEFTSLVYLRTLTRREMCCTSKGTLSFRSAWSWVGSTLTSDWSGTCLGQALLDVFNLQFWRMKRISEKP